MLRLPFLFALAGLLTVGCAATDVSEDVGESADELALQAEVLGSISVGSPKTGNYNGGAMYRAYTFTAKGGDTVTGDVQIQGGDGLASITDQSLESLATDDDSGPGQDAKVVFTVPGSGQRQLRLAFRNKSDTSGNFKVKLDICNRSDEPWREYYYSPQKCIDTPVTCTAPARSFQNSCGCGCENPH